MNFQLFYKYFRKLQEKCQNGDKDLIEPEEVEEEESQIQTNEEEIKPMAIIDEKEDEEIEEEKPKYSVPLNDSSKGIAKKNFFQRIDRTRLDELKPELKDNTFMVMMMILYIFIY